MIEIYCDLCGEITTGTVIKISKEFPPQTPDIDNNIELIGRGYPKTYDICNDCEKDIVSFICGGK